MQILSNVVNLRLSNSELADLDRVVPHYGDRSKAVRAALKLLLDQQPSAGLDMQTNKEG
ncbi:ribbon-helix-helix domain-containing protein [Nodosilinea sp. E11]|uniref:ribbon-helix-helix domain-containing protein n=1 Tax=Nodosilinea sp. E11 TaxID=3037479 RepID=UPI0029346433|nr:ribbon-helix-helix domain-containing protein [Nodosilinea sp. E11]WOD41889.1 ribbon-helix-helix domain-containing protein [Nodosilinea sp. E11]